MRIIKSFSLLFFICALIIQLLHNGCSDEGTNPNDKKFVLPESDVSFYEHIEPLFNARCGLGSGCHSPTDIQNPLLYNDLVNRDALIYHPLSSTCEQLIDLSIHQNNPHLAPLYLILAEGYPSFENWMPPPNRTEPLNENQLNGIRQWISEGAPE